ncbi:MAG TPA: PadR family transcriptional regulator [Caulobacteraceae bacterium]|nr:PadR family transcriptional regulator [Caulobacteraceae bacterium]
MHRFHHNHHGRERFARHGFGWGPGMRGHGPGMGERHGRRGGRVFEQGDLRLVLLKLIAEKSSHGYELIKAVEDAVGGAYAPSPGVVYPTLTLLEDLGYAKAEESEGGKRRYAITPEGQAFLDTQGPAVDALFARMGEIAARNQGRNAPQIMRAMENLGTALR